MLSGELRARTLRLLNQAAHTRRVIGRWVQLGGFGRVIDSAVVSACQSGGCLVVDAIGIRGPSKRQGNLLELDRQTREALTFRRDAAIVSCLVLCSL